MSGWADEVRTFWLAQPRARWFARDDALDAEIRRRFLDLWGARRSSTVEAFLATPGEALGAVILFDQFPRNMFRDHADSFATDHLAVAIAREALDRGYDADMKKDERMFLYMPFEHSEDLEDQERAVALFVALGDPELIDFARRHHAIVERFGRFPHRNAALGRAPRPDEIAAGDVHPF
jgi:uncharacterized protein (DUF924 family)